MRKVIKIICFLICMISIFFFSQDKGEISSSKSNRFVMFACSIIKDYDTCSNNRKQYIEPYSFFVRKLAHFTIYFILAVLLISTICEYRILDIKSIMIAFVIAFLYACSDEFHQLFIEGRSAKIFDVLLDSFGAFTGIMIYQFFYKCRRRI